MRPVGSRGRTCRGSGSRQQWQKLVTGRPESAIEFSDVEAIGDLGKTGFRGMIGQKAEWDGMRRKIQDREMQIGRMATL